jgi:hypothetical protein
MTTRTFEKQMMPLLARHEGDWYGYYTHTDATGNTIDEHYSHLISAYPADGSCDYHQINRYLWTDGRKEEHLFPGNYDEDEKRMVFDTERIYGWAREVDERHVQLMFTYKGGSDKYVYEFVHLSDDGQHRTRIWHWYDGNGEVYQRTLIKETREATEAHEPIK